MSAVNIRILHLIKGLRFSFEQRFMNANDSKLDVINFIGNFHVVSSKDFAVLNISKEKEGYNRSNVSMKNYPL